MRHYTMSNGTIIDLDMIAMIDPVTFSKVASKFSCYDVHFVGGDILNVLDDEDPRSTLLTAWTGVS